MAGYRNLEKVEIQTLEAGGCSAEIWAQVKVADGFDASRVRNVAFQGEVRIGALAGMVSLNGVELPSGIADARLVSCDLGDNVRVTSVKGYIANYSIGAGAVVCDIGEMVTRPGATFGNGVEIIERNRQCAGG